VLYPLIIQRQSAEILSAGGWGDAGFLFNPNHYRRRRRHRPASDF
jgi:hypothetical protein